MELVWERTILVSPLIPVRAHRTILWEIVWVNTIRRSGVPILLFMSAQGLQNTFALHPYFRQTFEYSLSMHSFPPRITTLIKTSHLKLVYPNSVGCKNRRAKTQRLVISNILQAIYCFVKWKSHNTYKTKKDPKPDIGKYRHPAPGSFSHFIFP